MAVVLVTGGAGFLGSHLCERLLARGDEVICLDNFFTGRKANIAHSLSNPRFELIRHDIVHPVFVEADQIYNLACPASPPHYQFNPIKTIKTSTVGMVNMLGLAKRCRARLFQASTSEVYGDPEVHPQTGGILGARQSDRTAKLLRRREARRRITVHELPPRAQARSPHRPHLQYLWAADGPARRSGGLEFHHSGLAREPLTIFGEGRQTRSFCYVDDLIEGFVRLMDQNETTGPINLGNPGEFTMLELAQNVLKLTGSKSPLKHEPLPADDPKQRCPDITRAKAVLDWSPQSAARRGAEEDDSLL